MFGYNIVYVGLGILILLSLRIQYPLQEDFVSKNKDFPVIGSHAIVQSISIRPKFPNLAVPFRKHIRIWKTPVPLTPFKAPLKQLPPLTGALPDFFIYNPAHLTKVINQGDCGSCWAFMVCDILSNRLMIRSGGVFRHNLSTQQLMACFNREGCDGDSPETAMIWLDQTRTRLHLNSKIPYTQGDGGYVNTSCARKDGVVGIENGSVKSIVQFIPEKNYDKSIMEQNIINMKRELIEYGPFLCAMTVYDDFMSYTGTSVYSRKSTFIDGGHAVEVIGYCDAGIDPRKGFEKAYWICKSSWGDAWPTESNTPGYFMIEMGKNMCGIESRAGIAEPELFARLPSTAQYSFSDLVYTDIQAYLAS